MLKLFTIKVHDNKPKGVTRFGVDKRLHLTTFFIANSV